MSSSSKQPMDSGYSWLVLISSFSIAFIILGQVLNFGIYYVVFLDYFGSSRKATSLPGALSYSLMCAVGPVSSVLQKRFGARFVICTGAMIASTGLALSYLASHLWHLYITYGVLCGLGYGLCMTPSLSILPDYFEKYRYFVTSFAAVGASLGTFIFAPFTMLIIDTYTWRGSMLIQAGICLQLVIFGLVCKSRHVHKRASFGQLFDTALLKNVHFHLLLIDGIVLGGASFTVFSMINSLMVSRGLTTWQSAKLMSVAGLSNMAARILAAVITPMKCTNRVLLYSLVSLLQAAGIVACVFCDDLWSFAVAVIVFGFSIGIKFSQAPNAIIDLFGVEKVVNGIGYFMFSIGFGGFVLPLMAGWLADQWGTENAFIMAGVNTLIGFVFCCVIMFLRRRRRNREGAIEAEEQEQINIRRLSISGT